MPAAVAAPRDHEAVPRRRRERRRRLRGGRGRGARAARRERRRQVDALEHPHRPLPARRGRDPACTARRVVVRARRATRSTPASAWCTSTSGSSPPFTVAENVILGDHRGEGKKFVVHPRAHRAARRRARRALPDRRRPARAHLAALARRAAARRDPEGALPRGAHPDPRRADRRADAAGGRLAVRDAARDGGRGAHDHLHLAQAARGEGGLRPRHGAARRQDGRDGRRRRTRRSARSPR